MTATSGAASYYLPLGDGVYQPTVHVEGAWNPHEQHMAPVSGLLAHAIDTHEPREGMQLARISYEILGLIPADASTVSVRTVRPGRTIELVEATLSAHGRLAVRASAWRLARHDSAAAAGGGDEPMPEPGQWPAWDGTSLWAGGYIASIEGHHDPATVPGRGRAWLRTTHPLVEGVEVSQTAAFLGLVDTANGIAVRADPAQWMFPNVDLSVHLHRQPEPGWVGLDTTVVLGADGIGLTSSTLHDVRGPVGRSEQSLTIRPVAR